MFLHVNRHACEPDERISWLVRPALSPCEQAGRLANERCTNSHVQCEGVSSLESTSQEPVGEAIDLCSGQEREQSEVSH